MKIQDLKKLMGSLSLHEKIGQLVQLDGGFFGAEEVPTGPCDEMGIAPWVVENAGSVLNVLGVNKVQEVQQHHLQHSRIPLLFMADVVYGYKTLQQMVRRSHFPRWWMLSVTQGGAAAWNLREKILI